VCGHGSINFHTTVNGIKRTLAVDDVLYVPGLGTSLLSIAAVTDVGLSVHFIETQVFFSKDQTIVMIGERIGKSLYHLAIIPTLCDASQSQFSACFAVPSASYMAIWHQRLTHTSYKTIIKMASDNVVD
jgi:hypothetical protein